VLVEDGAVGDVAAAALQVAGVVDEGSATVAALGARFAATRGMGSGH
jgi:hypothetical protein